MVNERMNYLSGMTKEQLKQIADKIYEFLKLQKKNKYE